MAQPCYFARVLETRKQPTPKTGTETAIGNNYATDTNFPSTIALRAMPD